MWDDQTGTVWSHIDGLALSGDLDGAQLPILQLRTATWAEWLADHPETTVMSNETRYEHSYRDVSIGRSGLGRQFRDTLDSIDPRLPENTLVIGALAGTEARAFPLGSDGARPMQAELDGVPLVVLEDSEGTPSLAYHRKLSDGQVLDFERRDDATYDVQTGTRWSADGLALEGELAGVQLTFVTSFLTEWYGWAAFHPETSIYEGG